MARRKVKIESSQSIPEIVDELTRQEIATWYKDGKLTPHGKQMAKLLDRALPAEKVDEWCFLLTRKEIEAIRREAEEKKRIAADYQYYLSCSELHVATLPASQQEQARQGWAKILPPFPCREPWLCPG